MIFPRYLQLLLQSFHAYLMLYTVHSEASLPKILIKDFLCLRNSCTELQILVESPTWFEVLKNIGCINPKTTLHILDSKTLSALKLWYIGFLPGWYINQLYSAHCCTKMIYKQIQQRRCKRFIS